MVGKQDTLGGAEMNNDEREFGGSVFDPWNGINRDSPFAPWNGFHRDDPFACWNNTFGHGDYEDEAREWK